MPEMGNVKAQLTELFLKNNVEVPSNRKDLFDKFIRDDKTVAATRLISELENQLMANWKLQDRIATIQGQPVRIHNASVGKLYEAKLDFEQLGWTDLSHWKFEGLEENGLTFEEEQKQISGKPVQSGDIPLRFLFKLKEQADDEPFNEKLIMLIVNPDPKSLWKNLDSDKNDPYWKEDNITVCEPLGDRYILASSKRGRSHANEGSFREDDFAFMNLENGWSIVAVSDGAGSARFSRKGSDIACRSVVEYFGEESSATSLQEFDQILEQHKAKASPDSSTKLNHYVYNTLGKAAFTVHKRLEDFASKAGHTLKDLSCTLIFTLFKRYESGYAFLSFGVGDCPIAVLNKDISEVTLLNWIDVGEFGGGTRFITMPEIFRNEKFATRFSFIEKEDFSYLMLMSDGIYDPKFVVEANLENIAKWKELLEDLNGNNEGGVKVELDPGNKEIVQQFSAWMDFWSTGNHDDRTLAIVF
ncbi:PP2C family serine/threonine-protein phosphatase [Telluribacter sp. SYSU D00476]|uniref:PP2C family serine/threonine-protein phosphatase n=1 Tax=Telluribacter sp. SYSU D00476 TaxID=2811430 RepID=UPI001FF57B6D|nr:PP2C family serine/threonine-protein phosphatase [Telluribacter sp. SYSU D00476]